MNHAMIYALCLTLFKTQSVAAACTAAAWGFLVFRPLHSAVHCIVNRVMPRFLCYRVSMSLPWLMLLRAAAQLMTAGQPRG